MKPKKPTKTPKKPWWYVRDNTGKKFEAGATRKEAREYVKLWDRDCPDEAPHRVVP
jgi:hypothetical protein